MTTADWARLPAIDPSVVSSAAGDGFVVLNTRTDEAHELTGAVAEVWSAAELGRPSPLDVETTRDIVEGLLSAGLLVVDQTISRRAMVQRTGAVVALVGLATIALPEAAAFASTLNAHFSPATGSPGDSIILTGSGFTANSTISVSFPVGLTAVVSPSGVKTGSTGVIPVGTSFTVPTTTQGLKSVTVAAGTTTTATFTVIPAITLSPTSGAVGSTVTVTGRGFMASSVSMTATYDGAALTLTGTGGTNTTGSTNGTRTFTVPASTAGNHVVTLTDTLGNTASAAFTVSPTITLSATSGFVGDTISVTGTGFAASSSSVSATYDGANLVLSSSAGTNAAGSISSRTFTIPASIGGSHTIQISDGTNAATASFTVQPKLTASPTTVSTSSTTNVTLTGTGFAASASVALTKTGNGSNGRISSISPASTTSNNVGSFSQVESVVTPSQSGSGSIKADDGTNTDTVTLTVS